MPTLRERGYTLYSALPDSFVTTDIREEAWDILHHTLFNNNINHLIQSLGLHRNGGWAIVREELNKVIDGSPVGPRKELLEYLSKDQVHLKCFLKMKLEGLYRDVSFVFPGIWVRSPRHSLTLSKSEVPACLCPKPATNTVNLVVKATGFDH